MLILRFDTSQNERAQHQSRQPSGLFVGVGGGGGVGWYVFLLPVSLVSVVRSD